MTKVTVIVPVYKVEKYLKTCFESLLHQTSKDFVVYAVNDGSPDNCLSIIRDYEKRYPELIRCFDKENGGYGSVLQIAIEQTSTPYFLICDPDDTLEPAAVETLVNLAEISQADITIGAKLLMYEDSTLKEYDCSYNNEFVKLRNNTVYNKGTAAYNDLFFVNPSPHAKLYRRELGKDISFPHKVGYTDNLLFYISLLNAKKVIYTDIPLANYLIDRRGNSMTDVSLRAMNGEIDVFNTIIDQAAGCENVPDIFWYRMFASFKFMLYQTRRLNCTVEEYEQAMDHLETFLNRLIPYRDQILNYYSTYEKTQIVERFRDKAMLDSLTSKRMYGNLKKKMAKEFAEAKQA